MVDSLAKAPKTPVDQPGETPSPSLLQRMGDAVLERAAEIEAAKAGLTSDGVDALVTAGAMLEAHILRRRRRLMFDNIIINVPDLRSRGVVEEIGVVESSAATTTTAEIETLASTATQGAAISSVSTVTMGATAAGGSTAGSIIVAEEAAAVAGTAAAGGRLSTAAVIAIPITP